MKGLYIHVPFCTSICLYCDFKRSVYQEDIVNQYLKQLQKELTSKNMVDVDTIYIGGGTPSALNINQLEILLDMISPYMEHAKEITIESNLESLNEEKIRLFDRKGVNRISLGVQSLTNSLLTEMNRKHTCEDVKPVLEMIYNNGIKNISVDMIYGFQNQSVQTFISDLEKICTYEQVNHVSMYSLTIEENSIFKKMGVKPIENEVEAMMYDEGIEVLKKNEFNRYEIANFSKEGFQSSHNIHYWQYDDFYGIGLGASGKEDNVRYQMQGSTSEYIQQKAQRIDEVLEKEDMMFEEIMMGLRLVQGVNIERFNTRYAVSFIDVYQDTIRKLTQTNQVVIEDGYFLVKEENLIHLHDILLEFLGGS